MNVIYCRLYVNPCLVCVFWFHTCLCLHVSVCLSVFPCHFVLCGFLAWNKCIDWLIDNNSICGNGCSRLTVCDNDVLFIAGLVAYWPARIHDMALLDLYCPHLTSGRLAVCYSQRRSIFSSATAFTTAKLRWQQSRYRTINGKKLKPAILWA